MRIVCWQTILMKYHTLFFSKIGKDVAKFVMKYHTLFFSKIGKDVAKFVVCCSCDWRFKG